MFTGKKSIELPKDMAPQLVVVIDTEEEFDWNAEPDSGANQVSAMAHIDRIQSIFNDYGICPCYVVDYPIASQRAGYDQLRQFLEKGQCEIGAHLHPWVTPPFTESLSRSNMYPGNLPAALEREKLAQLKDAIISNFGQAPVAYKAGRYGFGPNTSEILHDLGFVIDLSVCPPLDARADGGPDYRRYDSRPFWFGKQEKPILELPCTGAFVGWSGQAALLLFELAQRFKKIRAPGILARLGAVDRLMLSPEGFTSEEHIKLTRFLFKQGVRTFNWSLHSPSVVPGHTAYVSNESELSEFLDRFSRFFDFFFNEFGGQATSPTRMRKLMEKIA